MNQSFFLFYIDLLFCVDFQPGSTSPGTSSPIWDHIKNVENTLGVTPHKQSIAAVLEPYDRLKIKIGFHPKDDIMRSTLILVR